MSAGAPRRVAVIGAGWAGLSAAVHAVRAGHRVCLLEMAAQPGGRARGVAVGGLRLDNGQHILIGAYRDTLALMRTVGVTPEDALQRRPLALVGPQGRGLRLPAGPPLLAFARGVLAHAGWPLAGRLHLLATAAGWAARGFACPPGWTVARLARSLPAPVRHELIEPLCVAALNTPADRASAAVFLRVLRDALFSGAGASDLLLPRRSLDDLLPRAALAWLQAQGAELRLGQRVASIEPGTNAPALHAPAAGHPVADADRVAGRWRVDGEPADAVVLATTSVEAARLAAPVAPAWAAGAAAFEHEPIVTVYLQHHGVRLAEPMTALADGPQAPAQFLFDLGALGLAEGVFAAVVSGARAWVERGLAATADAVQAQLEAAFAPDAWPRGATVLRTLAERRATFACTPGLHRPPMAVAPGLWAAGDYVEGPYPSTLEGAVRSGLRAAAALG